MDRVDLFRIFTRVVECSSFTRAADTLGLARSSVSAAVQELEGRIGARLLHRTTRKVSPTQDGIAFYERCLRLIADVEEAESLFEEWAGVIAVAPNDHALTIGLSKRIVQWLRAILGPRVSPATLRFHISD